MTELATGIVEETLRAALTAYDREAERYSLRATDLRRELEAATEACEKAYQNAQAIRLALKA